MKKSYKSLDKLSLGNLILALEADLDSIQLQLQPRYANKQPFPRNITKIRLMAKFPPADYTLNRCHYKDELPGKPMSNAKKDWYKFKAKKLEEKSQIKLSVNRSCAVEV